MKSTWARAGSPGDHAEAALHPRNPHGELLRHGTEAFRGACYAVAAGVYDFCLALGWRS